MPAKPTARDLARWPLFYEFNADHWTQSFTALGTATPLSAAMVKVDDSHALLNLVLDSQGIGLFFADLIRDDLRLGHLHRPVAIEIDPGSAYYLTQATGRVMSPRLRTFSDWILDEAELDRPSAPDR